MAENDGVTLSGRQAVQAFEAEEAKLNNLRQKQQQIQDLLADTRAAEDSLDSLKNAKKGQKIMVSLGAGIYANAALESVEKVKTGLGGGVLVDATIEKAKTELAARKEGLEKDLNAIIKEENIAIQNLNNLGTALQSARQAAAQKQSQGTQPKK